MAEFIFERYNYWAIILLMMVGLYVTFQAGNMIKRMVGLSVFQTSVFLFYVTLGKISGGSAPILFGRDYPKDHGGHGEGDHGGGHGAEAGHGAADAGHGEAVQTFWTHAPIDAAAGPGDRPAHGSLAAQADLPTTADRSIRTGQFSSQRPWHRVSRSARPVI